MPTISIFFGIAIRMYYDDHNPPHFHAHYGDDVVSINIDTLEVIEGSLKNRPLALVLEWANAHRAELRENWQKLVAHETLKKIAPLE